MSLGPTDDRRHRRRRAGPASPGSRSAGGFDPAGAPDGSATLAQLHDGGPPRLGDGVELDRPAAVRHLLGRQADRVRADPACSCSRSSAAAGNPEYRAFVVVGSALWAFVVGGMAGLAWSVLDDRERYRMLKYLYVSPSRSWSCCSAGAPPAWPRGDGRAASRSSSAWSCWASPSTRRGGLGAAGPSSCSWASSPIVALGIDARRAICMQTRQESWSYPEAVAGALFLVVGAIFPLVRAALGRPGGRALLPLTWWLEGVRQAPLPGVDLVDRRDRVAVDAPDRDVGTGRRPGRPGALLVTGRGYTRRDRRLPRERASRQGAGPARPDHGLLTRPRSRARTR